MTNEEKYKDAIMLQMYKTGDWAVNKRGEITPCCYMQCAGCKFRNIDPRRCIDMKKVWLQSEYEEQSKERNTINDEPKEKEDIGKARKIKQLLFVEDGSVDMFNLYSQLSGNPEIAIIVYRQNSRIPVLVNLEEAKE